ncbi:hypothetical protein [Microbulbifer rhizosphaerae]|uniref:Spore Coat Protein U domain-containing protein n=1 Tax=Microbulbifer rhizosphaerae TaxID=1562603 RepID=A0A7W4Z9J7_9GAMM|nr:hypothetical protein [Microbulbifer rhizosphaerae]MBB3061903.1 hypothetical protein [Microbulbifer rhizosphaerae]
MLLRANSTLLALGLLCIWTSGTTAQPGDPCNTDTYLGVCGLTNPNVFTYDSQSPDVGQIPFSVRSYNQFFIWSFPVNYTVTVQGAANGTNFLLSAPGGQAAISMDFTDSNGATSDLLPDTPSAAFQGSINAEPVFIDVILETNGATLLPDTYTGIFQLSLNQQGCLDCRSISDIELIIELVVAPEIRISGLSDMAIDANLTGLTEAQQTFCVYSQGGAPFGIAAGSANGNGSFLLTGNVDQIEYETWMESLSSGGPEQLTEGQPSALSWSGSLWDECTGSGENMQISIRIQQSAITDAMESSYTDTLTLTVELD